MKIRKARKAHNCTLCGEPILKGSTYVDVTIRPWDHPTNVGYGRWRLHEDCMAFWNDEYGDGGDFMWDEECGEFKTSLEEWKNRKEQEKKQSHELTTLKGDS